MQPPRPEDICSVCYTSGTTGKPKGVVLTHENIIADVSAVILQLGEHRPNRHDVMISFLPLAHMLERSCEVSQFFLCPVVLQFILEDNDNGLKSVSFFGAWYV